MKNIFAALAVTAMSISSASAASAAVRPGVIELPSTVGKGVPVRLSRKASADSSSLVGIPLLFIGLGAAAVTAIIVVVVVATNSSPQ